MSRKRWIILCSVVACLVLSMSASGVVGAAAKGKVTNIMQQMPGWGPTEFPIKTVVSGYNLRHPGINVEINTGVDWNALQMEWKVGKTSVDLMWGDTTEYYGRGGPDVLADWDQFVGAGFKDTIFKSMIPGLYPFGKLIGVPLLVELASLSYRKDLLKEAGLPGPPKTWDEFYAYAKKMHNPKEGIFGMSMDVVQSAGFTAEVYIPMLQSMTGKVYSKDQVIDSTSKEAVQIFKMIQKWYKEGLIPEAALMWATADMYKGGNVAQIINWQSRAQWAMSVLGDDVAVAPLPSGGHGGSLIAVHALFMPKFSKVMKEAGAYGVEFSQNSILQEGMIAAGKLPPYKSWYVKGKVPDWMLGFKDNIDNSVIRPSTPWEGESEDILGYAIIQVLKFDKSPEEALKEATSKIQNAVAKAKQK
ncbi:MAG: extracellular solute-binding protein [Firmicutes bacterium]|nr:extracellular solute-binding protein [Bacillota bacterium]